MSLKNVSLEKYPLDNVSLENVSLENMSLEKCTLENVSLFTNFHMKTSEYTGAFQVRMRVH